MRAREMRKKVVRGLDYAYDTVGYTDHDRLYMEDAHLTMLEVGCILKEWPTRMSADQWQINK